MANDDGLTRVFWNTLDDLASTRDSEIGPDIIVKGGSYDFRPAEHGGGFVRTARDTHLEIPSAVLSGLEDAGTIELWVNPLVPSPRPYEYGIFGLVGRPYSASWGVPAVPNISNIGLSWGDGVTGRGIFGGVWSAPRRLPR
jgi:hypothetical protein